MTHRPRAHAARHRSAARRPVSRASWEVRSFAVVTGLIAAGFLLVLLYLGQATAVSASGYEAQRLESYRDELRRQNALLEIESARLASPARVEADAARLGLVRAATIAVLPTEAVAAQR